MVNKGRGIIAADAAGIAEAIRQLAAGGIVALPTETVYGLAADASNPDAVAAIYRLKGRPAINPLIVHVSGVEMARLYADFPPIAEKLAEVFWPGPLTMVLPVRAVTLAPQVTAGLATVALRMPAHPVMQQVIAGLGRGLAAPSANVSGRLSPTQAAHVAQSFEERAPLVLDGGPTESGIESTIVAVGADKVRLLRLGGVTAEDLARHLGYQPELVENGEVSAPGMLLRHYAPRVPLRLNAEAAHEGEAYIGFGPLKGEFTLSDSGSLEEAAHNLFAVLHEAESSGVSGIAMAPIPNTGIGRSINDRLTRAARG